MITDDLTGERFEVDLTALDDRLEQKLDKLIGEDKTKFKAKVLMIGELMEIIDVVCPKEKDEKKRDEE